MVINSVAINEATTSDYLTGDLNGPTLVWGDQTGPTGTWTKTTEPSASTWAGVYV